jgi:hypothetical protein
MTLVVKAASAGDLQWLAEAVRTSGVRNRDSGLGTGINAISTSSP